MLGGANVSDRLANNAWDSFGCIARSDNGGRQPASNLSLWVHSTLEERFLRHTRIATSVTFESLLSSFRDVPKVVHVQIPQVAGYQRKMAARESSAQSAGNSVGQVVVRCAPRFWATWPLRSLQ